MKRMISFTLNGEKVEVVARENTTLLDLLRNTLGIMGTKKGCEEGECGACTVLFNGKPVNSCLVIVGEVEGQDVLTIEGLAMNGEMHPIQQEFIDKWALQCGFCTPGMILSAKALLDANPSPTEDEIRDAIAGNLCRCTGYAKIVEAIQAVAPKMRRPGA